MAQNDRPAEHLTIVARDGVRLTGEQFGVRIVKRSNCPNDAVQLISGDDGNWFEHGGEFDAAWIDDMIEVLRAAQKLTRVTYRP